MELDVLSGFIAFAALVILWAIAPTQPAAQEAAIAPAKREALA